MKHLNKLLIIQLIIFISCFISACNRNSSPITTSDKNFCIPDSLLKNVTFDTIHLEPVITNLKLAGTISVYEDNLAKIFPMVSGHVSELRVSLGDFVEKGKILAVIKSSDMAAYYNDYKTAKSELLIAKKNLEVTSSMRNSGVSSDKDILVAQTEYQKALSEYDKMKEILKINGSSFLNGDSIGSGYIVRAPISGFIAEKNITVGMDIRNDAGENLFTISDLKQVWAIANVFESDISKIKIGSDAEITTLSYPGRIFKGKVNRILNILDPETKAMSVKILLQNDQFALKPGMFANISISLPENRYMLALKTSTIIFENNRSYIIRFNGRCKLTELPVTIYNSLKDKSYIECGSLRVNDIAIARNGLFIFTALNSL